VSNRQRVRNFESVHARGSERGIADLPAPLRHLLTGLNSCRLVFGEDAMTFTIHASKNGQSVVTVRISPAVAVDKARVLESLGWQVHVTDSAGHQFDPADFDRLSSFADQPA
jgi:hypothetical protein